MNDIVKSLINKNINDFKELVLQRLTEIALNRIDEARIYISGTIVSEAFQRKRNINVIKMGRIYKIRRRVRRNDKGRITVERNRRRSGVKGYRISGNTVKRIPTSVRIKKARLLRRSWKTKRRSQLRRSLLKRKITLRRRKAMGL